MRHLVAGLLLLVDATVALADPLPRNEIARHIVPPFALGEPAGLDGVWTLLNSGGAKAGYVLETEPLAPLPGFSGTPINLLVTLDLDGRFLDVRLLSHNEPIFVSGLGEAPFHAFFDQYPGLSIGDSMVVGAPNSSVDAGSGFAHLDGVTKATASVRIAHESLIAAAREVARQKMQGVASAPPPRPDPDMHEALTWQDLVDQGLLAHKTVRNHEVDAAFAGTVWADDDPLASADPDAPYLDLWVIDVGPPSIARAVLSEETAASLARFRALSPDDEPILVIETARHGLVSADFVRNTAPDRLAAEQDGLPIPLRDADLTVELAKGVPEALHDGTAMILRSDRRLGFDPTRSWTLTAKAVREHGMFHPEIGTVALSVDHATDARFFTRPAAAAALPPWREALHNRQGDMIVLAGFRGVLMPALLIGQGRMARLATFAPLRLGVLAAMAGFVGFWGQGQLSIVTPLAALGTALGGGSFAFLLYDPFSLAVWAAAIVGLVLWGRGFFCGWLCPFGALQEFADRIGRRLRLPQLHVSAGWDRRLRRVKYLLLAGLAVTAVVAPGHIDTAAEVEPFKTAVTVFFVREWYYVTYAAFWLVLGLFMFKGFCRYVCPLGALMAIGGALRGRDWIARRAECGSPCQLCRVKCRYGAIARDGRVDYSECFQCLDCVAVHDDPRRCVPCVLAARGRGVRPAPAVSAPPLTAPAE